MASLKGPLFSLEAHGQVAQTVIYETHRGRPYAKAYGKPSKPASADQLTHRARIKALATTWRGLSVEDKATWATYCTDQTWNHYARFIDANTKHGSDQGTTITRWPPSAEPPIAGIMTDDTQETPTGLAGEYTITATYNAYPTYTRTSGDPRVLWYKSDENYYVASAAAGDPLYELSYSATERTSAFGPWLNNNGYAEFNPT